ncbi:conserved hypothetical protein [Streptomyces sp. SPB074]|nr:conserved hypothetical protein [Streptomyces sp. SPB074]
MAFRVPEGSSGMVMSWKRSSYSGDDGGDCVEVGTAGPSAPHVLVRDSKRAAEADTPVLHLAPAAFAAFLAAARTA